MLVSWSSAYCLPVEPSVATRMRDADPITIPSIVSRNGVLLERKLWTASVTTSLNIIVERALASVRSKEVGLARFVVAITLTIRRLLVSQRCTVCCYICRRRDVWAVNSGPGKPPSLLQDLNSLSGSLSLGVVFLK